MINGYCRDLKDTFNVLAYFGVLEEEDAQCFQVKPHIEGGSYILLIAAAMLALLNSFVMSAVRQYFRDRDDVISRIEMKEKMLDKLEEAKSLDRDARRKITPLRITGRAAQKLKIISNLSLFFSVTNSVGASAAPLPEKN
jgi:hypothetical protein